MTSPPSDIALLFHKLTRSRTWEKLLYERFAEPLHLNIASLIVALLGGFRARVKWDLLIRPQYAYGVLHAADQARAQGLDSATVIEFGVANGEGLMNLASLARRAERTTGIHLSVVGFDLGTGMPPPIDHRDHPELYKQGDFLMEPSLLNHTLPSNCLLKIGPLTATIAEFFAEDHPPIGFAAVDVDYYSSAKDALACFAHPDLARYLRLPVIYFDDIMFESHNEWCGELLAIHEFNAQQQARKIAPDVFLATRRIFKHPRWLHQMYLLHLFDHPWRNTIQPPRPPAVLANDYFRPSRS
jgi:hypothetical protein